jgi:hypothetical protein
MFGNLLNILNTLEGIAALLIIAILIIILWLKPYTYILIWLLLVPFSSYFRFPIGYGETITFFGFSQIFLTIGMLLRILSPYKKIVGTKFSRAYFLFLIIAFITVLFGKTEFIISLRGWLVYVNTFLFFTLAARFVNTEERVKILLVTFCCCVFVYTFVGFYQYIFHVEYVSEFTLRTIPDDYTPYAFRVAGIADIPSAYGIYLIVPLIIVYNFYLLPKRSFVSFLLFFALFASVIINFTRATIFASVAAILVSSYFRSRSKITGTIFIAIIGILIYFLLEHYLLPGALTRKWHGFSGRIDFWKQALPYLTANIFYGDGIASGYRSNLFLSSHNMFLQYIVEIGMTGLIAFLFLLNRMFRKSRQVYDTYSSITSRNLAVVIFSCLIAYTIIGLFGSNIFFATVYVLPFWIFLGALFGLSSYEKKITRLRIANAMEKFFRHSRFVKLDGNIRSKEKVS